MEWEGKSQGWAFDGTLKAILKRNMNDITVLGCGGGLTPERKTTAFRVGKHILIDAGSGLERLSREELIAIDHIFLTHAHLDHVSALPLLIDAVCHHRDLPILIHCLPETESALRNHIFNDQIWPDMTQSLGSRDKVKIKFLPISIGKTSRIDEIEITPIAALHTVPAIGYALQSSKSHLFFTGDSAPCPEFWSDVAKSKSCSGIIVDVSFPDSLNDLAKKSGHMTPSLLKSIITQHSCDAPIFITHMKPGFESVIGSDLMNQFKGRPFTIVEDGMSIDF